MDAAEAFLAQLEKGSWPTEVDQHSQRVQSRPRKRYGTQNSSQHFDAPHSHSNIYPSRGLQTLAVEEVMHVPLDAFDKQLLAETDNEYARDPSSYLSQFDVYPSQHIQPAQQNFSKLSRRCEEPQLLNQPKQISSPSSFDLVSSPTVSALRNRQRSLHSHPPRGSQGRDFDDSSHKQNISAETLSTARSNPFQAITVSQPLPPKIRGIQLVSTAELSARLRSVFSHEVFNVMQSRCFPTAFHSDDNLVVSAPTGSGKTAVMELAICRLLTTHKGKDFKIVYQAPTKSLCAERYRDWQTKFSSLELDCAELTGDTQHNHMGNVQKAHIIITTPEKWDSVTRKWKDHRRLMDMVKLFLVDEVHILKESRGATLEAVISRMRSFGSQIRFIALSATIPNSDDIATWLGKDGSNSNLPAHREVFDESFRPVPLQKHVYGSEGPLNDWAFDNLLRGLVPNAVERHSEGRPVMVFCCTRPSALRTAQLLADKWETCSASQKPWKSPIKTCKVEDRDLRKTIATGVAFHHGGLSFPDRTAIEQGFLNGEVQIICSTSTLAVGVNLPCYLVILQGTSCYANNSMQRYSDLEVMQMLGRAGRPQFETSACAVILTRKDKVERYEKMVSGQEPLESCLHQNLIEHLNAEIGLGTIHDMNSAKNWLRNSFLYVRLNRNLAHYRFREDLVPSNVDQLVQELCEKDVALLQDARLIEQHDRLRCTDFGDAMARYCINFETMKTLLALPPKAKISEILSVLCQATEFREVRMRSTEKAFYKALNNANEIRFPIKVDIAQHAHKISLIFQAELGTVTLPAKDKHEKSHHQFLADKFVVFGHANRLVKCIIDCQLHLKDAISAKNALELGTSIASRVWDNTPSQLRQIESIGEVSVHKLAAAGIRSIEDVVDTEAYRIEMLLSKAAPYGINLLKKLESFPRLRISVREILREVHVGTGVIYKIHVALGFLNVKPPGKFGKTAVYVCFLAETSDGQLLDFRRFWGGKLQNGEDFQLVVKLTKPTKHIRCHVMCDEIAGTAKFAELSVASVDDAVYATNNPELTKTLCKQLNSHNNENKTKFDIFDDEDIKDDEFLKLMNQNDAVVDDIDDILTGDKKTTPGLKAQKRKAVTSDHKTTCSEDFKDQVQVRLPNGNWTCRHTCKVKGVDCKHQCCREGVSKPSKKPRKTQPIEDMDRTQQKLTQMAEKINPSKTKLSMRSHSLPDPYKATQKLKKSEPSKSLSIMEGSYASSPVTVKVNRTYDVLQAISNTKDSSYLLSHPSSDMLRPTGHMMPPSEDAAGLKENEIDEGFCHPDECDWPNASMDSGLAYVGQQSSFEEHDLSIPSWVAKGHRTVDSKDNDRKLNPPFPYVRLDEVHPTPRRGLFITGDSSSPVKKQAPQAMITRYNDASDAGLPLFDWNTDVTSDMADVVKELDPAEPQVEGLDRTQVTEKHHSEASNKVRKRLNEAGVHTETDEAKSKRLYEEDQKKKWEGLDPWLYEEFHNHVELV